MAAVPPQRKADPELARFTDSTPDGASGAEMTDPTIAVVLNGGAALACHADLRSRIVYR